MLYPLDSPMFGESPQTWLWSEDEQVFVLDVFRERFRGRTWLCRRDESITRDWDDMIEHSPDGIPHIAPEIGVLFKAKHLRPKDQQDFRAVLPELDEQRRAWLRSSLQVVHPGHEWLVALT